MQGSGRPTGTVTFLFTDIEGSTVRWDRNRTAMQDAVRRHDALMQAAIAAHDGYVFKTIGDAFCAAFSRPEDGVAAILDAQRALAAEDFSAIDGLRVRAAVHTGTADERDNDYFGPTLNRVARLLAIGHGSQILVSTATRELAHAHLPAGAHLVDLGFHQLRDLIETERVWQLNAAGLPHKFPALRSIGGVPNNLPVQRASFVGRDDDIADVKTLLTQHRMLTLLGSGGVGKTRLAVHLGAELLDRYRDGVWFVDLAPISDPGLVASVTSQAFGIKQGQSGLVEDAISQWLRSKQLLLILDNCEHVVDAAAALASAILATAHDVSILATSRQTLNIKGEARYRLPSLAVPDDVPGLTAHDALNYGAIALFVDRARAVDSRFTLSDDTVPVVAHICRRLDGIALAIELAAARIRMLSLPNLAQRLDERFKILTGGGRDVLPRQRTLMALVDWSYDLLTPQEQLLFSRLGVFAGGFGLEAATNICGDEDLDEIDIFDLFASLTDKSLVVADTSGDRERYHLLESTRAYALEKLAGAGAREHLARRHAEYFRDQAQQADERYMSGSTSAWLAGVEFELDDYRAVLAWALNDGHDFVLGGAVAGALGSLWYSGGLAVEGRYWIGLAQAGFDESAQPRVAARMWRALGALSFGKLKHDAAQRALALFESVGDEHGRAWALQGLAFSLAEMGRLEEAGDVSARAVAAMRTSGNKPGVALSLMVQAAIQLERGGLAVARELFAQALSAYKALGDEAGTAQVLPNLAELAFREGQVEQALRLAGEAIEIHLRGKNALALAISYCNITAYRVAAGDLDGAREAAYEGLHLAQQVQSAMHIAITLQHLALLLALRGEVDDSAQLIGYVNVQYKELGSEREGTERWGYEKVMAALHERLSDAQIEKLAAEGAAWTEDQAVEKGLKA